MTQNSHTLLLDMDGTLLDLHFDNYFWSTHLPNAYAIAKNIDTKEAIKRLQPHFKQTQGTLDWYCTDYWSAQTGLNILELKTQIKEKIRFLPNVQNTLQALKGKYKEIIIITNAHPDSVLIKNQQTQIASLVDDLISAHEFEACKEEQEFWQKLDKRISLNKAQTLFIDDNLSVLESAHQFGIASLFQITQPDSTQPLLQESKTGGIAIKIRTINELNNIALLT